MATLADSDIADLVTGTLRRLGRLRFQQIAQRLQNYEVLGRMFKKDKVQFDDGYGIQRTLMVDHSDAAKQVGLHEVDNVDIGDVLQTITCPWRHSTVNYAYERREILMNRGGSRIVDLMKVRRADAMIALAEHIENQFWRTPASSTDKLEIYGIPYWIVTDDTTGFNGKNNSVFTDGPGGLNADTYTRWANYTGKFTEYDDTATTGLVDIMRGDYRKIRFKSPTQINDFRRGGAADQYRIYCNENVIKNLENFASERQASLGVDIAAMDGVTTFRRNPIIWVPDLDNYDGTTEGTTANPVYMLDMSCLYPVFLRGDYLRESAPRQVPNQHNTWQVHIDLTWNLLCVDRRRQAVIASTS